MYLYLYHDKLYRTFSAKGGGKANCSVKNGGCEQKCNGVKDGFYCSCWNGYYISASDGKSCEGNGNVFLFIFNLLSFRFFPIDG